MRTFVVSDIHGDAHGLRSVLMQFENAGMNLHQDRIIYLGDYVDGYEHSREVVDAVFRAWLQYGPYHVIALRGNHEQMLLDGWDQSRYSGTFRLWYQQGGKATAMSYGLSETLGGIVNPGPDDLFHKHLRWFEHLPYYYEDDHYYYVHAGFRPGVPVEKQDPYDMLWIRSEFIDSDYDFGKMVVFGHTAVKEPIVHPTKIQLDTRWRGAGYVSGAELFPDKPPVFYKSE